jgi:hypothetical protein
MTDPAFAAIIGAIITTIGSIIVAIIQTKKEGKEAEHSILVPKDAKLHKFKKQYRWTPLIITTAIAGGLLGYGVGFVMTQNIKALDSKWRNYVEVRDYAPCPRLISSQRIDATSSDVKEEIIIALKNLDYLTSPKAPWVDKNSPQAGSSAKFLIENIGEGDWLEISKTLDVSIDVNKNIPDAVDAIEVTACGGGGEERIFPDLALDNNYAQYSVETTYPDFDFFTLQPGEFEIFYVPFQCDALGLYQITIKIPFRARSYEGNIEFTEIIMCPQTFTLWQYDQPSDYLYPPEIYEWDGSNYFLSHP